MICMLCTSAISAVSLDELVSGWRLQKWRSACGPMWLRKDFTVSLLARYCAVQGLCVWLSQHGPTAANPVLQVCCSGLGWQEISIDCCTAHNSVVGSWQLEVHVVSICKKLNTDLFNDEQCCLGTVGVWLKCRPAPHRHSDLHVAC